MRRIAKNKPEDYDIISDGLLVDSREIFLQPASEYTSELDGRTAETFLRKLRLLESRGNSPIVLHISCIGGDYHAGMAIYDAIQYSTCKFVAITYGIAASMGSIIPQAVYPNGKRITMPNCDWMIHEGYTGTEGTNKHVIASANWDKVLLDKMFDLYSGPCLETGKFFEGRDEAYVKRYLKKKLDSKEDWWLSAEDSVYYGFCDMIVGEEGIETVSDIIKSRAKL
ncbi:ATP-dependent Clp protease proteolytic subunit [bacterium]|nr:ATP-dependent Clp protease proteolytic subunit [bacterium]